MKQVKDRIREFIIENFFYGEDTHLENDTLFLDEGIIDSTGMLELIGFLEDEFNISISDEEMLPENLNSLANLEKFMSLKIQS